MSIRSISYVTDFAYNKQISLVLTCPLYLRFTVTSLPVYKHLRFCEVMQHGAVQSDRLVSKRTVSIQCIMLHVAWPSGISIHFIARVLRSYYGSHKPQ